MRFLDTNSRPRKWRFDCARSLSRIPSCITTEVTKLREAALAMLRGALCPPFLSLLLIFPPLVSAQDVILNPAFITGDAGLGTVNLTRIEIDGSSPKSGGGALTAETILVDPSNPTPYSLTVQVEEGTTRNWSVKARLDSRDGTEFVDAVFLPAIEVEVGDGETLTGVDFVEPAPCFIQGDIIVNGDMDHIRLNVHAERVPADGTVAITREEHSGSYSFPAPPGRYRVVASEGIGPPFIDVIIPPVELDCFENSVVQYDIEVDSPTAVIHGTVDFPGVNVVDQYFITANGPVQTFETINRCADFPCDLPINTQDYAVGPLIDGAYQVGTRIFMNYFQDDDGVFRFDDDVTFGTVAYAGDFTEGPNRPVIVDDMDVELNISADQAYIDGLLQITGSASLDIASFGRARAMGLNAASAGSADLIERPDGAIDIVAHEGDYALDFWVRFSRPEGHPDGYIFEDSFITDHLTRNGEPLRAVAGESVYFEREYCTGSLTVNFVVLGGENLSGPELTSARCDKRDPDTGAFIYRSRNESYPNPEFVDVPEGQATLIAPEGQCTNIRAQALVSDTLTTFDILEVEMECGVDKILDIGAPSLLVLDLPALSCLALGPGDLLTVSGTATDDTEIESISVNGITASLSTTENPSDPNEVAWSANLVIAAASPLELNTVATDITGKVAEDLRTVNIDASPPAVGFSPADGAIFYLPLTSVSVEGVADDDAGITALSVNGDSTGFGADGTFSVAAFNIDTCGGAYPCDTTITVEADDACNSTSVSHVVTLIANQPPDAYAQGPYAVPEGSTVQLNGAGTDPDGDPLIYEWNLDGLPGFETSGQNPTFSAEDLDGPDNVAVTLRVTDDGGLSSESSTVVEITNVAPLLQAIVAPLEPVPVGTIVEFEAAFTDAGKPDTHVGDWSFGDSSVCNTATDSECSVVEIPGSGDTYAEHGYSEPGVYTVSVTLTDDDGGSDFEQLQFVVVYDPTDGFVTGGGHILSPPGAMPSDHDATGQARFGFVSKYLPGATVPSGSTEFQFHAGVINFHSNDYEWLVVTHHVAKFKGTGTINQSGNYGFMLTAIDERLTPSTDVDKFRIKIWDKDNGDIIVYDNQIGAADDGEAATALTAGSIVIHTRGN